MSSEREPIAIVGMCMYPLLLPSSQTDLKTRASMSPSWQRQQPQRVLGISHGQAIRLF